MPYTKQLYVVSITLSLLVLFRIYAMEEENKQDTEFTINHSLNQHELETTFSNMLIIKQPVIINYSSEICFASQNYHRLKIGMGEDPNYNNQRITQKYLPPQQCWLQNSYSAEECDNYCRIDDDEKQIKTYIQAATYFPPREDGKYDGKKNIFDGVNKRGFAILCSSKKISSIDNTPISTGIFKEKELISILNLINIKAPANRKGWFDESVYEKFHDTKKYKNWFITSCALSNAKKRNDRILLCRINNNEKNILDLFEITKKNKLTSIISDQVIKPRFIRMSFLTKHTAIGLSEQGTIFTIALISTAETIKTPFPDVLLSKQFFYTKENGKKKEMFFKDIAIDKKHRPSMLLLTTDNRFFHCNLISKKTEYLFCKQEKNIEQIWLYNHRIGFNTKNTQNKTTITIIPLAFFLYKNNAKKILSTPSTDQ